jgi:hypothetical protein
MTSAQTKAKRTVKTIMTFFNMESLPEGHLEILENLVKREFWEHERDTKYAAIDIIASMQKGYCEIEDNVCEDVVYSDEAISLIHKLSV